MLQPDVSLLKLTFNAPAGRIAFAAPQMHGVHMRLYRGDVQFHATSLVQGDNVAALKPRGRGGYVIHIEMRGIIATKLLQTLQRSGLRLTEPFFVLQYIGNGWFGIDHYPLQRAPPKHVAHLRVWRLTDDAVAAQHPIAFDLRQWARSRRMVVRAAVVVQKHEGNRGIGRPSNAVQQAKQILNSLRRLVTQVSMIRKLQP